MSCTSRQASLLDAALGGEPTPELDAHLAACPACRGELAAQRGRLARIDSELQAALETTPGPALAARVRERLAREAGARAGRAFRWTAAAVVGAALAIAAAAWLARSGAPPDSRRLTETAALPRPAPVVSAVPSPETTAATTAVARPRAETRRGAGALVSADAALRQRPVEPEVLVPSGEEQALRRFVARLRLRPEEGQALLREDRPPGPLPDLSIAPLDLKPLSAEP